MEKTKTIKVNIPDGYEIDKEKSTFENIVLKKKEKEFSDDWAEFCVKHDVSEGESYISYDTVIKSYSTSNTRGPYTDRNLLPSKEYAEAMLALCQLLTIREKEYTKGWKPNWGYPNNSVYIIYAGIEIKVASAVGISHVLSFPTRELAGKFLNTWKNLIEKAKILL